MKKETYLPLRYAAGYKEEGTEDIIRALATKEVFDSHTCEDLLAYVNDDRFYTADYTGPYEHLNAEIRKRAAQTLMAFQNETPRDAWGDVISMYALVSIWSKSKQVYKFDKDFAEELSRTDSLRLYPELLRRLPYDTMYFDLSDIDSFAPYVGMFVGVRVSDTEDLTIMGHKITTGKDGELYFTGTIKLSDERRQWENGYAYYSFEKSEMVYPDDIYVTDWLMQEKGVRYMDNRNFPELWMFVFQALTYLSSEMPDIEESKLTKRTYHPAKTIKNKFSEIRQWEVGVRFGTDFRKHKAESKETEQHHTQRSHKSPRPHSRKAHWHRYWTGEGRTQLIMKWIRPVFVGARGEQTATVHKVKGESA